MIFISDKKNTPCEIPYKIVKGSLDEKLPSYELLMLKIQ